MLVATAFAEGCTTTETRFFSQVGIKDRAIAPPSFCLAVDIPDPTGWVHHYALRYLLVAHFSSQYNNREHASNVRWVRCL
jgi:hypothetical protein